MWVNKGLWTSLGMGHQQLRKRLSILKELALFQHFPSFVMIQHTEPYGGEITLNGKTGVPMS